MSCKGFPHIIRLLLVVGMVILCYHYPTFSSEQYLNIEEIQDNTIRSLYLSFAISIIWPGRAALSIILIELFLIGCNFYTGYYLETGGGVFNKYYSALQTGAYVAELIIMFYYIIIECLKIGKNRSPHNNRHVFYNSDSHSFGDNK